MVKGIKIKIIDRNLIRRLGTIIIADPSVAKIYVNKGLAEYVEKQNDVKENQKVIDDTIDNKKLEIKIIKENKIEKSNKLFPKEIIGD